MRGALLKAAALLQLSTSIHELGATDTCDLRHTRLRSKRPFFSAISVAGTDVVDGYSSYPCRSEASIWLLMPPVSLEC